MSLKKLLKNNVFMLVLSIAFMIALWIIPCLWLQIYCFTTPISFLSAKTRNST